MIKKLFPAPLRPGGAWRQRLSLAAGVCAAAVLAAALANSHRVAAAPKNQIAVYRPSTGEWFIRTDSQNTTRMQFGAPGDVPVPRDYFGKGQAQIAVFRPSTQEWFIRSPDGSAVPVQFGAPGDVPMPGDYFGLGRAQIAVFRPSTQEWFIRRDDGTATAAQFGGPGDQPMPADYLGQGHVQIAVFRPSTREWFIRHDDGSALPMSWGGPEDMPVPGDYLGLNRAQVAIFRQPTGEWFIRADDGSPVRVSFGGPTDRPMAADFDGTGRVRIAVFRPETQEWFVRNDDGSTVQMQFGGPDDIPVPAAYGIAPSAAPATPAAPANLAATVNSPTQVTLTWTDNSSDETSFKIERKTGAGAYAEIASVAADTTTYGDTGLAAATSYTYRVRAVNAVGPSGYSNEASASTSQSAPAAPSNLAAAVNSPTQITLTWTDNSSDETGFKVERKTGTGAYAEIASPTANTTTYVDTGLTAATDYSYRVRAVNAGGPSAYSNEVSATTAPSPPAAPSNLAAAPNSATQVTLTWTDNSSDETGFKVERRTGTGAYAEIASPAANVTTYADSGLTAATSYTYRVRAVNGGGASAYSNEATATTPSGTTTLTLAKDIQPIFTANCALSGCHANRFPQEGMDLSSGNALSNTVNVNSAEVPSKKRVKPGDPDNSFLYEKISSSTPSSGARMPFGLPALSQANIDKIRTWIQQGANP